MAIKIATWNVNSIRQRLDSVRRFVEAESPDLLCLQEIKARDEDFPALEIEALGYRHQLVRGEKSYNGVAILARAPFSEPAARDWCDKGDKRHATVMLDREIELHNFYVPSGGPKPDREANPKFDHKLSFLTEMAEWARDEKIAERPLVLVGDLNVAPLETDVWNHKKLLRNVGHTPVESEHMATLLEAGSFIDVERHFVPPDQPLFTWWGYRFPQAFERDYGWRLDHVWVTPPLASALKSVRVCKETRSWPQPSDHVPVLLTLG